jgi:Protein of unknown function (DUF3568)
MLISFKRLIVFVALVVFMMGTGGCLSPVVMHVAGGAAVGAGPSSFNYLGRGKAESYFIAQYDDVIKAALQAGEVLSLQVQEKKVEAEKTSLQCTDDKANKISLLIERRTDTMTSITYDVGWFGSIAFGHLVARQIIFELYKAGAFPEDWKPAAPNY